MDGEYWLDAPHLITHGGHIFSANLAALELADEETDGLVFTQDEHERILDAAVLDLRARGVFV